MRHVTERLEYRNLRLVMAPQDSPLSVADAKDQMRVTLDSEDAYIATLIQAATGYLDGRDGVLGRALMTQTWEYVLDAFPLHDWIWLPLPPIQSVTSITYRDTSGNVQIFAAANYSLSADTQ